MQILRIKGKGEKTHLKQTTCWKDNVRIFPDHVQEKKSKYHHIGYASL